MSHMSLQLFNALTGKKETFRPLEKDLVRMYNCGPTVYNYAHIGNLRAYVFADILRRTLEYNGYMVKQVMNITDVGHLTSDGDEGDDKMVKALKREGKPFTLVAMREIADFYTEAFKNDLTALNIKIPETLEHASDHIGEDIQLINKLEAKGFAYKTTDGMYFDTAKFPSYGKLGNINLRGQLAGARVAVNSEKKNPADFTLWKLSTNELGWDSPWGRGFPGWHIECSAMSSKYLGQPFDIHTGGIDHIPVHHNNEIAQSEAANGVPLANYWLHNEHLIIADGKMAKSGVNFITLQTLKEKGIHPLAFRYYLLQTHYRSPLNFSWNALQSAQTAYFRLLWHFTRLEVEPQFRVNHFSKVLKERINEDLNTPQVLSFILGEFEILSNRSMGRTIILDCDKILGLDIGNQAKKLVEEMNAVPEEIKKIISAREETRKIKDFKTSDELRDQIQKAGFEVMDTDSGSIVRKKL